MEDEGVVAGVRDEEDGEGLIWLVTAARPEVNVVLRNTKKICWLVIKGLLMTTETGQYKMAQYLDEQQMHQLYENFVLGYFKREYPQYSARAAYIDWNVDD